ncbi:MAG: hypothetical protein O7A68_04470 [Alphaproteobacteria bacterium]|nr:hypothetical protein [Alphaproteobacteria bacterium]
MPALSQVFEQISMAKVATSAAEARDPLYLGPEDAITMKRNPLLADAKARALALADVYQPPDAFVVSLPGPSTRAAFDMAVEGFALAGKATAHDRVVGRALAEDSRDLPRIPKGSGRRGRPGATRRTAMTDTPI